MKKNLLFLAFLLNAALVFGQTNKEDIDIIQSVFGKEKKALMSSFVQLDPTKQDAFWKLYDEYETSRKALGKQRIALLEKYAANYTSTDEATVDGTVKEIQKLQASTDKLIVQYYGKMKKAAGAKPAAQFYQLETYLPSVVRAKILDSIPFIGELDKKN